MVDVLVPLTVRLSQMTALLDTPIAETWRACDRRCLMQLPVLKVNLDAEMNPQYGQTENLSFINHTTRIRSE